MAILFWSLSVDEQVALMQYQWQNYGTKLEVARPPEVGVLVNIQVELDEIDKLMRQAPHSPKRLT